MKVLLVSLIFILNASLTGIVDTSDDVRWLTDFEKAQRKSKKEKKPVLLYFTGSDWCAPCIKLKKDLFETDSFKAIAEDYVLVYVDIPRNQDLLDTEQLNRNKALMKQFNPKGVFPLFAVLNTKGKLVDSHSGYAMTGDVSYHLNFLKNNAK